MKSGANVSAKTHYPHAPPKKVTAAGFLECTNVFVAGGVTEKLPWKPHDSHWTELLDSLHPPLPEAEPKVQPLAERWR